MAGRRNRRSSTDKGSLIILIVLILIIVALFAAILIKDRVSGKTGGTPQQGQSSGSNGSNGGSGGTNGGADGENGESGGNTKEPVWHEQSEQDAVPAVNTVTYTPPQGADLPYYIKVNRAMCTVTVYGIDADGGYTVPVRAFVCSVGKPGDETISGEYELHDRFDTTWCYMVDGSYSQYAYRIHNGYMFHIVPSTADSKNHLETEEYNKLGEPASLGCVRLTTEGAKWISDNCKIGTKVLIYDDAENPGPLGKPAAIKIPVGHEYAGWDPTDPDENNPWNSCSPRIEAGDITVSAGSEADILQGARAYDTCGNDISGSIYWYGKYTTDLEGSYTVTLGVTDALGRSARKEIRINVSPSEGNGSQPDADKVSYRASVENLDIMTAVKSEHALLISRADKSVLLDKKGSERVYPASIVKMMTLLVSLENLSDMNERLVITQETYDKLLERHPSMSGLPTEVPIRVIDMLHGSFMPSGADASVTLAIRIAGSESAFVELMNQKAASIGMNDTHYINATGFDEDGQYTTCADVAKLLDYALGNSMFRQIFTTRSYTTEALQGHPEGVTLKSTMFNSIEASEFDNGINVLGGKTGYTDKAGMCLASLAESKKSGNEYILVTMKAPGDYYDGPHPNHVKDAVTVYSSIAEHML